ncbi:unnamed protein product [Linum tenue]|uniref:Uncharacterized protein n=1 Tax=Linum tenue TaxID=586396 RepID=A0AAV0IZB1_9ROSI|nr:unnamed protein product [Linum tenue]
MFYSPTRTNTFTKKQRRLQLAPFLPSYQRTSTTPRRLLASCPREMASLSQGN